MDEGLLTIIEAIKLCDGVHLAEENEKEFVFSMVKGEVLVIPKISSVAYVLDRLWLHGYKTGSSDARKSIRALTGQF